jgi:hypothetical protein
MSGYQVSVITVAVFDTKPYDREGLQQVSANHGMDWHFLDFRLTRDVASASKDARIACVFVNDQLNWPCLEILARQWGVLVALRSIGFNYVDIDTARHLKLTVTGVPVYSAAHGAGGAVNRGRQGGGKDDPDELPSAPLQRSAAVAERDDRQRVARDWRCRKRSILLQDCDRVVGFGALFGEIHAGICRALGCVAGVTKGAVQDLPRIEGIGFQLFAGSLSVSNDICACSVDFVDPVELGGLHIVPGNLLHGDLHGVQSITLGVAGAPQQLPISCTVMRKSHSGSASVRISRRICWRPN